MSSYISYFPSSMEGPEIRRSGPGRFEMSEGSRRGVMMSRGRNTLGCVSSYTHVQIDVSKEIRGRRENL